MKIGILGGGQLGMMIAEEAIKLNHEIISLDPQENCSITKYSKKHLVYSFNSLTGVDELVNSSDVLTYEFENVSYEVLKEMEAKLPQKIRALQISQNRLFEKELASKLNIRTPKYLIYNDDIDLFFPSIIKTTTGGYDGKGQMLLNSINDLKTVKFLDNNRKYIVEELIDFDYEISVIASRDSFGNIVYFPIPINTHKEGILFSSVITDSLSNVITKKAKDYTKLLLEELDYIGTLAVEFFVKGEDVIFNEFAPRPHNSGHYTIEGCNVSQFKNHVLAITKKKVIEPILLKPTIMLNVIGKNIDFYNRAKNIEGVFIHDYHKEELRDNRKMGHITITNHSFEECLKISKQIIGEEND